LNIVVIGMGEVGKHIASFLSTEKHNVTIIDSSEANLSEAENLVDALALCAQGGSVKALQKAHVSDADLVISVTDNDEVNMLAALTARSLGARKTIARVGSREYLDGESGFYHNLLGIDLVISPQVLASLEIVKLINSMGALQVKFFADNRIEMIRLAVREQIKVLGSKLKDIKLPDNILLAAIHRDDRLIIPSGEDELLLNDDVYLIGRTEQIPKAEKTFGEKYQSEVRNVVICGGGEIGYSVARSLLGQHLKLTLIERNKDRCLELSQLLSDVIIINGDGTDPNLLEEVSADEADVFVSVVSRGEEVNLLNGLLARNMGAKKTIVLVHKPAYQELYERLGIDATVSPRLIAADQILKYVRSGEVVTASMIEDGTGEILEIIAPEGARIVGRPLRDLRIPRGALIGAVYGPRGAEVPRGDTVILPDSTVVVFTLPDKRKQILKLFRPQ
jgi:trk system potassium uptake protein TrkA